jgi:cob(I)alamin adenosyltransferase
VKIYTRTGDQGETGLYGGERVPKDHLRVEAYGTVDEANAVLGLARVALADDPDFEAVLDRLQSLCFAMGADLATPFDANAGTRIRRLAFTDAETLEREIDRWDDGLPALRTFILPGGTPAAAALHHARTVVRRAERLVTLLLREEPDRTNPTVLVVLNRLGDLLFVLARAANVRRGVDDIPWTP